MKLALDRLGSISDLASGQSWSATVLAAEVRCRAERLRAAGVSPGDRLLVIHGGTPAFFGDLLAIWETGACAACLNPASTAQEIANVSEFIQPIAVVHAMGQRPPDGVVPALCLDPASTTAALRTPAGDRPGRAAQLDDPALVLFTSGTTGDPKGVVHSFRTLLSRFSLNQAHIPSTERRRVLCPLPTHFGHGLIGNCLTPLLAGGDVHLMQAASIKAIADLGRTIDRLAIDFMSSVPSFWHLALKVSAAPTRGTLRRVHVGSAPLSSDLWRGIIAWSGMRNVVNMYGITETANWIGGASALDHEPADGLVGSLWGGTAAIRDESGAIRAQGRGEVVVQGPSLMVEYLGRPDLTRQVLDAGWLRTGDVGEIDTAGVLRLTGRSKLEINQAGVKVHPEELDLLLERHPCVRDVCTFAMSDALAGEIVAVAVAPAAVPFTLQALREWAATQIVKDKQPQRWFVLDAIPRTERGKIDRAAVAAECARRQPS